MTVTGCHVVGGEGELSGADLVGENLGIVLHLDAVLDPQLLRPSRVNGPPHHVTGGAGCGHRVGTDGFHCADVFLHRLAEQLPLARYQHGGAAAALPDADGGKVNPGLVEQVHRALAYVVLDIGHRTPAEVAHGGLLSRAVLSQ